MYNKQTWLDEIPDMTRPIMDSSGKQKTDPQTGRPLFELVQTGTRITSNRLNTMEGGIEAAHTLVEQLAKEMGGNFVAAIDGVMGLTCSAQGLKANWTAGVAYVGGKRYEVSAGEMALNPTQGQYLYVDIGGVVKKTTSQATAEKGLLLFYVATDTSGVISTTDQRVNLSIQEAYEVALEAKQLGNERKADVVAALIAMGISASTSDTWSQLITKMTGVVKAKGNAKPSDVRAGKSFSNLEQVDIIGTLPERTTASLTITPGVNEQIKSSGIYGGDIIVPGEPNLVPGNILEGKTIFAVKGGYKPTKFIEYPNMIDRYYTGPYVSSSTRYFTEVFPISDTGKTFFSGGNYIELSATAVAGTFATGELHVAVKDEQGKWVSRGQFSKWASVAYPTETYSSSIFFKDIYIDVVARTITYKVAYSANGTYTKYTDNFTTGSLTGLSLCMSTTSTASTSNNTSMSRFRTNGPALYIEY